MSFVSNFIQKMSNEINEVDYSFSNLSSYNVFVPGLCFLVQKVQLAILGRDYPTVEIGEKASNMFIWHFFGSGMQFTASILAVTLLAQPIFAIFATIAIAQFYYTLAQSMIFTVMDSRTQNQTEFKSAFSHILNY